MKPSFHISVGEDASAELGKYPETARNADVIPPEGGGEENTVSQFAVQTMPCYIKHSANNQ